MNQVSKRDVSAIRDWLAKEPYMPNTFDDVVIEKFLYSCDSSLERTKQCLETFSSRRAAMPEVYCHRDPLASALQAAFNITLVTTYMAGEEEVLIHKLTSVPEDFDFYACVKAFTAQSDNWLRRPLPALPTNHLVVFDLQCYTLKLIPKVNLFYFQKFLVFLLESMPVRLKQVHVINCPSFCDYLYNLVKPALPEYICNLVHFHSDHTGLHKFIDKKYLPKDYGGERETMAEQNAFWIKDICDKRKTYLDDNLWKADLTKKLTKGGASVDDCMSGSFRTLVVD
ncbi:alpha-tocopherol transfer protein-like isoform X2 [Anticarsia gemmatalis]